jgi:bacterioferritin-associated ferredoxin
MVAAGDRGGAAMIVCSCNVFGDAEIRTAFAGPDGPGTVSQVYRHLGHEAHCGRCTRTVLEIMREREPAAGERQR